MVQGRGAARGGLQAALPHSTGPLWLFLHLARAQGLPGQGWEQG